MNRTHQFHISVCFETVSSRQFLDISFCYDQEINIAEIANILMPNWKLSTFSCRLNEILKKIWSSYNSRTGALRSAVEKSYKDKQQRNKRNKKNDDLI